MNLTLQTMVLLLSIIVLLFQYLNINYIRFLNNMNKNIKHKNRAIILNNVNREIIEINLSQKDIQSLLRFRRVLSCDISNAKPFDENNYLIIKVLYEDNNSMHIYGGHMFVFENN